MNRRLQRTASLLLVSALTPHAGPSLAAQSMTPQEFHDRIAALIADRASRPLPQGDTSVTWTRGPVLYHTVSMAPGVVRSGLLRNDSMLGLVSVWWGEESPTRFEVVWLAGDSLVLDVTGQVTAQQLQLAGARQDRIPVPTMPWAVADFGMEEHLVPLIQRLGPSPQLRRLVVYRPYGGQWDTLAVRIEPGPEDGLRVREPLKSDTATWVLAKSGVLLQMTRDTTVVERRPLEQTAHYLMYRRLRVTPPDLR